eukprot:194960-Chlamydomonas_euryale.AAC.7
MTSGVFALALWFHCQIRPLASSRMVTCSFKWLTDCTQQRLGCQRHKAATYLAGHEGRSLHQPCRNHYESSAGRHTRPVVLQAPASPARYWCRSVLRSTIAWMHCVLGTAHLFPVR